MPLDRSVFSGYKDPNFVATVPMDKAFTTLQAKSEKPNKKTGKSPFQVALEDALSSAQDKVSKADLARKNAANAAVAQIVAAATPKPVTDTTAEEAQKQQDKQAAALVEGLKTAWAKGTLRTDRGGDLPMPKIPQTPVGLPSPKDQGSSGPAAPSNVPVDENGQPIIDPSTVAAATGIKAGGGPVVSQKVAKLQDTVNNTKQEIADIQASTGHHPDDTVLGALGGLFGTVTHYPAAAVAGGFNWLAKPGGATVAGITQGAEDVMHWGGAALSQKSITPDVGLYERQQDTSKKSIPEIFNPAALTDSTQPYYIPNPAYDPTANKGIDWSNIPKQVSAGWQGQGKGIEDLMNYAGVPNIPIATPIMATIIEGGLDPTNLATAGIGTVAKEFGLEVAPKALIDIKNSAIGKAVKAGTVATAEKGATRKAVAAGKDFSKKVIAQGAAIGAPATKHEQAGQDAFLKLILSGESPGKAVAAARVVVENSYLADAAAQKLATATLQAAKDNKRFISLKLAGHETGLGKLWPINEPYQAIHAAKEGLAGTKFGKSLKSSFDINYWYPGASHILHNKAEAAGVAKYHDFYNKVKDVFSGLSVKDRERIASETELGRSLAGVTGEKGIDLGDAQKFFKTSKDQMFGDDVARGKYGTSDYVPDYTYHYYRSGTPLEMKQFATERDARLKAGATGLNRRTLADAEKAGLKPIKRADEILLAKMADHQRQMVNDSFNRKLIDTYGHVTDNEFLPKTLGLEKVTPPKNMNIKDGHSVYMSPEAKKVYDLTNQVLSKDPTESAGLLRLYDKIMRYWKISNTSLRPGHHIRNVIGDVAMNYMDGVRNPYRYKQGLQMVSGNRANLRVKMGQQVLNGDDIADAFIKGGGAHGFIANELGEGRNPLMHGINEFSDKREMFARYAHFIDAMKKEADKVNLGPNNIAGRMKAATRAAAQVNKWNINYGDLTPFERNVMKRAMPFYTWTRKAMPLVLEAAATRPGTIAATHHVSDLVSRLAGQDPNEPGQTPYPQWMRELGFARISNEAEPNVLSLPFPSQDPAKWLGSGSVGDIAKSVASNTNPFVQGLFELATGKNVATGASINPNLAAYGATKFGGLEDLQKYWSALTPDRSKSDVISAINKLTGLGIYRDSENAQLGELRRIQDPLQFQMSSLNKQLGDYEVHKLKYGYSVYNKKYKITEKDGFGTPAEAYLYALSRGKNG